MRSSTAGGNQQCGAAPLGRSRPPGRLSLFGAAEPGQGVRRGPGGPRGLACLFAVSALLAAESLGTISGVVLNAVSGAPLASSTVTLTQADGAPLRSFTTDRRGRYVFAGVPQGLYAVRASRPGFAAGRYGQKAWNHTGRVIELGAGAGFTAEVRLHRLGVITGSVVDENGEGLAGLTVNAVTANLQGLTGRVSSAGITDDRGVYRIAGLKPGPYYVSSAARQLEDGTGLLPTYAPGVLERREARVAVAEVDQETAGVHIRPVAGKLLRLSGFVPPRATVTLFREEDSRQATADAGGQFGFAEVVPGRYTLVVSDGTKAAYQPLQLADDIEGMSVNLAPAPEARIKLVDEEGAPVIDPQFVLFVGRIENGARTQPRKVESLVLTGLLPGRWRLFVIAPETHFIDAITAGDQNALDGFDLLPGRKVAVTVRVARRAGRIIGRARENDAPARGVLVICYPLAPENRARLGGFRSTRSSLTGEYRFGGLPPGEYLVFATAVEDFNPEERWETLRSRVSPVTVRASGEVVREVKVGDEEAP